VGVGFVQERQAGGTQDVFGFVVGDGRLLEFLDELLDQPVGAIRLK
jgi:hypothetical protein